MQGLGPGSPCAPCHDKAFVKCLDLKRLQILQNVTLNQDLQFLIIIHDHTHMNSCLAKRTLLTLICSGCVKHMLRTIQNAA